MSNLTLEEGRRTLRFAEVEVAQGLSHPVDSGPLGGEFLGEDGDEIFLLKV